MAKSRDPFFLALDRIRDRVQAGGYASGRPIVIVEEARSLGVSTTPVREALSWLCGEGLIERGPSGGFLAVQLDAGTVRDRYGFRLTCLLAGLDLTTGLPTYGRTPDREGAPVLELHGLFDGLVRRTGNAALMDAYDRVRGQLLQLRDAASTNGNGNLREALRAYHDRRAGAAAILLLDVTSQPIDGGTGADQP